jgi:hypothetical protein
MRLRVPPIGSVASFATNRAHPAIRPRSPRHGDAIPSASILPRSEQSDRKGSASELRCGGEDADRGRQSPPAGRGCLDLADHLHPFRHPSKGRKPLAARIERTAEVRLGPVADAKGTIGRGGIRAVACHRPCAVLVCPSCPYYHRVHGSRRRVTVPGSQVRRVPR